MVKLNLNYCSYFSNYCSIFQLLKYLYTFFSRQVGLIRLINSKSIIYQSV